jgi:hypothetical protein
MAIGVAFIISFVLAPKAGASNPQDLQLAVVDDIPAQTPIPLTSEVSSAVVENDSIREEKLPEPPPPPQPEAHTASTGQKYTAISRDQVVSKGHMSSTLTFYDCLGQGFCGTMANGRKVHEGAAACSYNLAMGTMFTIAGDPTNRVYICEDRGMLPNTHVDIFWNDPADGYWWQSQVGMSGTLDIIQVRG